MRRFITPLAAALCAALSAAACADARLPTGAASEDARFQRSALAPTGSTIVQTALAVNASTGEFSTPIAALAAADLVGALPGDALTDILLYHVAHGRRSSLSVAGARQIRMLNGDFPAVRVSGGSV